ncbi:23S rRNA (guanosine(2251)-2'-O)-methyltransferase RlmB [Alicyclobacillus cellulosilyticus]|uniref:23S rRNA (Guanosine(2251)-2'-O)-methyltransferase RlmB n=1 Tax=Alicyclobacillus cellulosilyticus TaxID=1003997 RepID=A0A917K5X9_9BACL|nr:23S rRNA (guanosine(2251)-2'-O)-methyltransferase RlmB [Alicyclobacillus cellulosilyticus]GGJ01255.1 23S rRNA (guanosine(2251)-2'-O)-methyltransferase RlmB [Alicyclobacillus cellulosilyticus]
MRRDGQARKDADEEKDGGQDLIWGRHPVLEALRAGRPVNKVWIAEGSEGSAVAEVLARARELGAVVQRVPRSRLDAVAGGNHQGVAAWVAPYAYAELADVLARDTGQVPLLVLLDELTDPHNFGAILRTAEATGVQGVIVPKRRSVALTSAVAKAAAGAAEYVPVARVTNLARTMEQLKAAGYWLVGLDAAASLLYTGVDYTGPTAIVVGAEGKGLGRLVRERCDYLVRLPMLGRVPSLNASVAAGVLLYEVVRQRA